MDENNIYQEPLQPIKKKKSPLLFIIPVVIVAFLVVFFVVPPVLSNLLASKGDYKKAISIVKLNPVYKSKARELKYESYAYDCMKQAKQYYTFKNPDSISIRNVNSYHASNKSQSDKYIDATIIELTAQNGYGGNTFTYLIYDNVSKSYWGETNDLDKTEPTSDDEGEINECLVAQFINSITEYSKRDVHINIDRLNKAIKTLY